jgi:hypothetical protein
VLAAAFFLTPKQALSAFFEGCGAKEAACSGKISIFEVYGR